MGLRGQVDSEAVLRLAAILDRGPRGCRSRTGGTGSGRRPLRLPHCPDSGELFERPKFTSRVGLVRDREVLRGRNDIVEAAGLDLVVVLAQSRTGVANELKGACADCINIKVILLDDLIDKACSSSRSQPAVRRSCAKLQAADRSQKVKVGRCFLHLHQSTSGCLSFLPPNRLVFCPNHRQDHQSAISCLFCYITPQ